MAMAEAGSKQMTMTTVKQVAGPEALPEAAKSLTCLADATQNQSQRAWLAERLKWETLRMALFRLQKPAGVLLWLRSRMPAWSE